MSFVRLFFVLFAFTLFTLPAFSDANAETKIAVLNIQEIMRGSTAAKAVREQLESKQKVYKGELDKLDEQLRKEDQELAKQRTVLSPEAFEQKVKEFRSKATEAQKEFQTKKGKLDNAFAGALDDIQKATYDIVSSIAKERGLQLVMPTSQLLFADPTLHVSAEVLKRLNEKLPSLTVNFDSPKR